MPEDDNLMNKEIFDSSAYLTITVEDVSRMDAPSTTFVKKEYKMQNGDKFPIYYEILYPKRRLIQGNRYNVRAEIKNINTNKLIYMSTTHHELPLMNENDDLYLIKVTKILDFEEQEPSNEAFFF
jgi:uncharacterized lipoprotein YbaY